MNYSLNEFEDAQRYLSERLLEEDDDNQLRVIARYYMDEGCTRELAREKVCEFVCMCGESASLNYWSDKIDLAIKRAKKTPLIEADYISVSKAELNRIATLDGVRLQRLAFTLLCLSKYKGMRKENNDHWICVPDKDIFAMANIKVSLRKQASLYRTLMLSGFIRLPEDNNSISMQILFADDNADADSEIKVFKMRNLGYQYLKYLGGPYFECSNCGVTVKHRNDPDGKGRPQKYCDECAALIQAQQKTEFVMRLRAGRKVALLV